MGFDDLFKKFDKSQEELNIAKRQKIERELREKEEQEQQKNEVMKFNHEFANFFANSFTKELSNINEEIQDKFILEFPQHVHLNKDGIFQFEIFVRSRKVYEFMPDEYTITITAIAADKICFISDDKNEPPLFKGGLDEFKDTDFRGVLEKSIERKLPPRMFIDKLTF